MLTVQARAKINIALDVLRRRPDGYHDVDMIMQSIDLVDQISLEPSEGMRLEGDLKETPAGPDNLVWKAAEAMRDLAPGRPGVRITLKKGIPVAAGLGGGSADAAAVIAGLNRVWDLGLTDDRLQQIGGTLGADVPFCIRGGAARANGIGTELEYSPGTAGLFVILFHPLVAVSTAQVYQALRLGEATKHPDIDAVWRRWQEGDLSGVMSGWGNVLENVTFSMHPDLADYKRRLAETAKTEALMSGSGPTLFCLTRSEGDAVRVGNTLREWPGETFVVHTVSDGLVFGGE